MTTILVNDQLDAFDLDAALAAMHPQRRQYLLRFRQASSQRAGAAAYMLLWRGLHELFGIADPPLFAFAPYGKPFLPQRPDIHFGLSHCADAAVCAISSRPIGIDVESPSTYSPTLIPATMNADEAAAILADPSPDRAFIELWTRKEAYLKLTGTGLTDQLPHTLSEGLACACRFSTVQHPDGRYIYSVCQFG